MWASRWPSWAVRPNEPSGYFQHRIEFENLSFLSFPQYLADWFCTPIRLHLIKTQQQPHQNHCPRQQTPQLKQKKKEKKKGVASLLARDVGEICKIRRNSAKMALTVARGNSWGKWVIVTSLLSLVCMFSQLLNQSDEFLRHTRSRAQADKTVQWRLTLNLAHTDWIFPHTLLAAQKSVRENPVSVSVFCRGPDTAHSQLPALFTREPFFSPSLSFAQLRQKLR